MRAARGNCQDNRYRKCLWEFLLYCSETQNRYCYYSDRWIYCLYRQVRWCQRMEYKSAAQMAAQWGISDRRVRILCQEGKIEGVLRDGRTWRIPADAEKPVDGRTTRYHRNDSAYAAWF